MTQYTKQEIQDSIRNSVSGRSLASKMTREQEVDAVQKFGRLFEINISGMHLCYGGGSGMDDLERGLNSAQCNYIDCIIEESAGIIDDMDMEGLHSIENYEAYSDLWEEHAVMIVDAILEMHGIDPASVPPLWDDEEDELFDAEYEASMQALELVNMRQPVGVN